jgi:hypothetical protein
LTRIKPDLNSDALAQTGLTQPNLPIRCGQNRAARNQLSTQAVPDPWTSINGKLNYMNKSASLGGSPIFGGQSVPI